jgi:hypothetical protein
MGKQRYATFLRTFSYEFFKLFRLQIVSSEAFYTIIDMSLMFHLGAYNFIDSVTDTHGCTEGYNKT